MEPLSMKAQRQRCRLTFRKFLFLVQAGKIDYRKCETSRIPAFVPCKCPVINPIRQRSLPSKSFQVLPLQVILSAMLHSSEQSHRRKTQRKTKRKNQAWYQTSAAKYMRYAVFWNIKQRMLIRTFRELVPKRRQGITTIRCVVSQNSVDPRKNKIRKRLAELKCVLKCCI